MALHALRLLFERHARRIMHGIVENGARRLGIRGEAAQDISDLSRCAQMHRAGFGSREQAVHLLHHDTGIAAVAGLYRAPCFHPSCPNSDVLVVLAPVFSSRACAAGDYRGSVFDRSRHYFDSFSTIGSTTVCTPITNA